MCSPHWTHSQMSSLSLVIIIVTLTKILRNSYRIWTHAVALIRKDHQSGISIEPVRRWWRRFATNKQNIDRINVNKKITRESNESQTLYEPIILSPEVYIVCGYDSLDRNVRNAVVAAAPITTALAIYAVCNLRVSYRSSIDVCVLHRRANHTHMLEIFFLLLVNKHTHLCVCARERCKQTLAIDFEEKKKKNRRTSLMTLSWSM